MNEYLTGVADELTPEQEKALVHMTTFLDTLAEDLGQVGESEITGTGEGPASPAGAAKRLAKMILKSEQA